MAGGLDAVAADLLSSAGRIVKSTRTVVAKTARGMERDAKVGAPVDTGNLRNSISVDFDSDRLGAEVGPTADYGVWVEHGTSTQSPQPFMGPAFDRNVGPFETAIVRAAGQVF